MWRLNQLSLRTDMVNSFTFHHFPLCKLLMIEQIIELQRLNCRLTQRIASLNNNYLKLNSSEITHSPLSPHIFVSLCILHGNFPIKN